MQRFRGDPCRVLRFPELIRSIREDYNDDDSRQWALRGGPSTILGTPLRITCRRELGTGSVMQLIVPCPGCQKKLKAREMLFGKRVKCPACGKVLLIPEAPPRYVEEPEADSCLSLEEAVEKQDAREVARFIHGLQFTLIQVEPESASDAVAPMMAEIDDFPVVVAFESLAHAQQFAAAMPELFDGDGSIPGFVVEGVDLMKPLPAGCGLLLNPETDDCVVFPPGLVDEVRKIEPKPDRALSAKGGGSESEAVRSRAMAFLKSRGFRPADWLPLPDMTRQIRPAREVAGRLMALGALFMWVSAPEEMIPTKALHKFIKTNKLGKWLTKDEAEQVSLSRDRAREELGSSIGWRLENMWPLAWVLGFDPEPTIEASQIDGEITHRILFEFLNGLDGTVDGLVQKSRLRSAAETSAMEDRFYCAHNAVRSAQAGDDTVPEGFHPVMHGGVVHERRHALTWCLSTGTPWDDTDLST